MNTCELFYNEGILIAKFVFTLWLLVGLNSTRTMANDDNNEKNSSAEFNVSLTRQQNTYIDPTKSLFTTYTSHDTSISTLAFRNSTEDGGTKDANQLSATRLQIIVGAIVLFVVVFLGSLVMLVTHVLGKREVKRRPWLYDNSIPVDGTTAAATKRRKAPEPERL